MNGTSNDMTSGSTAVELLLLAQHESADGDRRRILNAEPGEFEYASYGKHHVRVVHPVDQQLSHFHCMLCRICVEYWYIMLVHIIFLCAENGE